MISNRIGLLLAMVFATFVGGCTKFEYRLTGTCVQDTTKFEMTFNNTLTEGWRPGTEKNLSLTETMVFIDIRYKTVKILQPKGDGSNKLTTFTGMNCYYEIWEVKKD